MTEAQGVYLPHVLRKHAKLLSGGSVPNPHCRISATRYNHTTIRASRHGHYGVGVAYQRNGIVALEIPQREKAIGTAHGKGVVICYKG